MTQDRRTRANGRASRKAILAAAAEVFAEHGYRGTTNKEIASRVGITPPALLHHFRNKDELLLAVVQDHESTSPASRLMEQHVPGQVQLLETLKTLAAVNAKARYEQLLLTTLSAEAIPEHHPLHDYFIARYRDFRSRLEALLVEAQEAGTVRADVKPSAVSREILATLDGLHLQWLLDPTKVKLTTAIGEYAERLVRDLMPSGSGA